MQLTKTLKKKNISIEEIPKWGTYLRGKWTEKFAKHLSHAEQKAIFLTDQGGVSGYLWHLFSYNKTDYLEGTLAEAEFNKIAKDSCFIFYQHSDDVLSITNAEKLKSVDVKEEMDIYVVDKEFNWTFVVTHESGLCGPYFCKAKQ
jgi:hypothetical protein